MTNHTQYQATVTSLISPLYYLFKIDSHKYLSILDLKDLLLLTKDILHSVAQTQLNNGEQFTGKVLNDAFDLFGDTLCIQVFESSLPTTAMYNFEIRVINQVVYKLFEWFDGCSADEICESTSIVDNMIDEMIILYGRTEVSTDPDDLKSHKSILSSMCPVNRQASSVSIECGAVTSEFNEIDNRSFFGI